MASCHNRKKRCRRDGGEGVSGGREGGAPTSRGSAGQLLRGSFPPGAPFSAARGCGRARGPLGGHLRPRAPALAGVPLPGWGGVPGGLRADEQRGPGPGSRRDAGPGRAEPLVGISRTRAGARGALRVKQGRATRRLQLACAPGRIPGGYRGPPTARPSLHAGETDEKIKTPL